MLESLDAQCQASSGLRWTFQAVVTKADQLIKLENGAQLIQKLLKDIHDIAPTCLPGVITTAHKPFLGVSEIRKSIVEACGLKAKK